MKQYKDRRVRSYHPGPAALVFYSPSVFIRRYVWVGLGLVIVSLALVTSNHPFTYLESAPTQVTPTTWSIGFLEGADNMANIADIKWEAVTHIDDFGTSPNPQGTLTCDFGRHSCTSPAFTKPRATLIRLAHSHGAKVLMCITDLGATSFFPATSSGELQTFVANIMKLVIANGYDGVDIDWEANVETDRAHAQLAMLLRALRFSLGSARLLMADAIPDDWLFWSTHYASVDRVNFMAYDWEGNWNHYTWFNSALKSDPCDCVWSLDLITRRALESGMPARKITVGIPFYGHVSTGGANGPRQSPPTGNYLQTTYSQIVTRYSSQMVKATVDSVAKVPWFPISDGWVQYENPSSITAKLNYINSNNLGGWSLFTLNKDASESPLAAAVATVIRTNVCH